MTPRDDPLLNSAVGRAISAFTAICETAQGEADLAAFLHLLDDPKLGLTPDERASLRNTSERRLAIELWAEVTRRRGEGCFPFALRPVRRQAPN